MSGLGGSARGAGRSTPRSRWWRLAFRAALAAALPATVFALAACGEADGSGTRPAAPVVVATTTQIGDFVSNIAGERMATRTLVKPNQDPHDYEPAPADVTAVARSLAVFKNGAGLDDWLDRVLNNAGGSRPIVDLSQAATLRERGGEPDPHFWMDPTNVEAIVPVIRDALVAADPAGAATYRANAERYLAAVRAMDREVRLDIESVPPHARKMVTDHDAFRYFTDHYGIVFVGSVLQGLSTDQEPPTRHLTELIAAIKAQGVKAVFTERSLNPKLEQALAKEAGIAVVSTLYGDSLGESGSGAETYIGMMQSNGREIARALR